MERITLFLLATFVLSALCDDNTVKIPMRKRALNRDGLLKRREFIEKNAQLNAVKALNPKFMNSKNPRTGRFISTKYPSDYFLIDVDLGTPPQTFQVAVDSFDLSFWVLNTDYSGNVSNSQTLYNQTASSTGSEISDYYWDWSFEGYVYGTLNQEAFALERLTYAAQRFGSINEVDVFSTYPVDGLIGLGVPGPDDTKDYDMPLQNVADQLKSPSYTIWLGNHVPPSVGTLDGMLTLGGADNVNCLNDGNTVSQFYTKNFWVWLFSIDSVQIGKYEDEVKYFGFIDVGNPAIAVTATEFVRLLNILNADYDFDRQIFYVSCKEANEAPDITLTIGGRDYVVPGRNYIVDLELQDEECALALDDWGMDDTWVLGVPFMQAFCTRVNFQDHTVTFSTAKH